MSRASAVVAGVRLIHPAPALAVTLLSAALGAILLRQAGAPLDGAWLLTVTAVAGAQAFTGAVNDLVDRGRDQAAGRLEKPLASGELSPEAATWVAAAGLAIQLAASLRLGWPFLGLGLAASGSAFAYNLWLSRTPLSVLPYLVSFGLLPVWIAVGIGVPVERVLPAVPLVAPFAAAAHLANLVRDFEADAGSGSRSLAQVLGRGPAQRLALAMALGVGLGVGLALVASGRATPVGLGLGLAGLAAVGQGY
ncbi:MAG: UbiA family prenyltransferase, partial [Candidatus Limnocylindria bacterium]